MKGWLINDAVVVATESGSSPGAHSRNDDSLQHPVQGLFPWRRRRLRGWNCERGYGRSMRGAKIKEIVLK